MSVARARERLAESFAGEIRSDEPMSRHTSFRIGGPASLFLSCETYRDLITAVCVLDDEKVDRLVVGKGTNLLVSDRGYQGAVLALGREFMRHSIDGEHVRAGAAAILAALVQDAYTKGLAGLEFGVGIPGTFGGALAMNAGASKDWIGSIVESVTLYAPGEGLLLLGGSEVDWRYRDSGLSRRGIIVEGVLRLAEGDPAAIRRAMDRVFKRRTGSQPMGKPSAGSVFVNPDGGSAGRLIEAAGCKGLRVGGAAVSDVHANFIVNEGGATAADVAELIRRVREAVGDAHGIELRPEIRFIGPFGGS
ncbi:MAG: UDP-N-acetylmuramate dehydrogenase [Coriobacteriia bacterium]